MTLYKMGSLKVKLETQFNTVWNNIEQGLA